MISILVCSVKPDLFKQLEKNIEQTIGVSYELLCYDNRKNVRGLCEVYNLLANKAQYNVLCFLHEDIIITTNDWGKKLLTIFSENNVGAVGVAGSKYKSLKYSGWFTGIKQFDCANILHRFPDREERIYLKPDNKNILQDVVCLDGVFICCLNKVWKEVKFDEENLDGFHFYDVDFSLRVARKYPVLVTYDIDIIHITYGGDFGDRWVEMAFRYHQHNNNLLPFAKQDIVAKDAEIIVVKNTLDLLKTFRISLRNKIRWFMFQKLWLYPRCYYDALKFFIYRPLGLRYIHIFFKSK
jgi:hypothetical protein